MVAGRVIEVTMSEFSQKGGFGVQCKCSRGEGNNKNLAIPHRIGSNPEKEL